MNFLSNTASTAVGVALGVFGGLCAYAAFLRWVAGKPKPVVFHGGKFVIGDFMYVVKADQTDVTYLVTLPESATDSEGNTVPLDPALFTVSVESDNPAAVEILPDDDGDNLAGTVRFGGPDATGEPALANVNAVVHYDGRMVASYGAQFTVVAGDAVAFGGGSIVFDGLTEVPEPGPVEDDLGDEDFEDGEEPV